MTRRRWLYPWGLGSVAAGGASLLLPLYVVTLDGGPAALGLLAAVAAVAGTAGAYAAGRLTDRTGRYRALAAASLVGIAAALLWARTATALAPLVLANGLLWLSVSATTPVFTMLVVDDSVAAERSHRIARLNRVHGYGWAAGLALGIVWPVVGDALLGLPALVRQRAFLALGAGLAGVGALAALAWLPRGGRPGTSPVPTAPGGRTEAFDHLVETAHFPFLPARLYQRLRGASPRGFVGRFTPALATYFVALALLFAGFGMFFAPVPAYLSAVGYTASEIFALFLVSALGAAVAYGYAGRLVARYDSASLQVGALSVRAVALPAVALVHRGGGRFLVAAALFAVIGLSWAVVGTAAVEHIADLAPATVRGEALGIYTATSTLAGGAGGFAGGVLAPELGYAGAFTVACLIVLVSALVVRSSGHRGAAGRA